MAPAEAQQRKKALSFKVDDLKRFYFDILGCNELSLDEIKGMRAKMEHVFPDLKDYHYYDREQGINEYYKRFAKWFNVRKEMGLLDLPMLHPKNLVFDIAKYALDSGPLSLHYFAFLPAIELLASEEQLKHWVPKTNHLKITGAYVQTELGHGSDVSQLQTTATYDDSSKEFIIHTPSISATKFWPGGLGKTANHCVLYARLISKGKDHGVQAFVIQIRDSQTHLPLPGINIGDVGPKLGFRNSDQGFMSFNNVRVPKFALLDKFVKLSEDGTFTASTPHARKLTFGGMLNLRSLIIFMSHYYIGAQSVIASRYSFKRRQFTSRDGSDFPEALVIQYQMQQYKVVPAISYTWSILLALNQINALYGQYMDELAVFEKTQKGDPWTILVDLHGIISGFKALSTWDGEKYSEILKQACGGHGYMQIAGL